MTRQYINTDGLQTAEQIGILHSILGKFYFKHRGSRGIRITELETGYGMAFDSFTDASKYLKRKTPKQIKEAFDKAKERIEKLGIEFPVNRLP